LSSRFPANTLQAEVFSHTRATDKEEEEEEEEVEKDV
jgi:hypothetical protein